MKKIFSAFLLTGLFSFLLSACAPADQKAVDENNGDITQTGTLQNGRLTLPYEALQISTDSKPATNAFYVQTQSSASSVVKDYFFTTPASMATYTLQFDGIAYMSCDTNPAAQFYLVSANNQYTQVQPYISFQLPANTNYRLQFRTDNLNCYAIKVIFSLKQL